MGQIVNTRVGSQHWREKNADNYRVGVRKTYLGYLVEICTPGMPHRQEFKDTFEEAVERAFAYESDWNRLLGGYFS